MTKGIRAITKALRGLECLRAKVVAALAMMESDKSDELFAIKAAEERLDQITEAQYKAHKVRRLLDELLGDDEDDNDDEEEEIPC